MLKWCIIFGLLASIVWCTTPSNCRQTNDELTSSTTKPLPPQSHQENIVREVARNIHNYMDLTAHPCENFYQYSCGHWAQKHIDEQLDFGDILGLLDFQLNRKLEHLLRRLPMGNESSTTPPIVPSYSEEVFEDENSDVYHKVRTYYLSCKRVKPYNLKKYLQLVRPGLNSDTSWYILTRNGLKQWQEDQFHWLHAIAKLRLYGLNGVLLREEVLPRWDDSNSNSIYLDKPNLMETEPMGEGAMIELMLDIGQTKRVANEIARTVTTFEVQLHRLQEIEDEDGPKEMQLGYLCEYMPLIDWMTYLRQLKGPSICHETTVIIQNMPYMRSLVKLLQCVDKETICNYIMLKFLQFVKQQGPVEISKQECIASLRRAMPLAMSYIVGRHFYRDAHHSDQIVQEIFKQLKNKFQEILSDNRMQLRRPIVEALLLKISNMQIQVGNSPRNVSTGQFDEYYRRVELDANNFYVNQLSLQRLLVEKSHDSLEMLLANNTTTSSGNRLNSYVLTDWVGSSSSPFYVKPKNLIIVPYGFLQMPIYHRYMPSIIKHAMLGFTIAHELLHGFDSSGIDYDSVGNIMGPSDEIAANQRFMSGLRCMQNELATGSRTLNEKLADYEGFRLVFETYFRGNDSKNDHRRHHHHQPQQKVIHQRIPRHKQKPAKPALIPADNPSFMPEYTEKQVFFISFAQFFCGKVYRSVRQSAFLEHALDELRVLQTLANFEEFSTEFNCERKAKMQSKLRCRLW